jgi:ribosome-binding factor A
MAKQRVDRLNSLLKEVISEVIRKDVHNPHVAQLLTVTRVDITKDLHYAKVYVSVIGSEQEKAETLAALNSAAGFIAVNASQKVVMRYFPALTFKLDDSVDKQMRIEKLLSQIGEERKNRDHEESSDEETSDEQS